MSNFGNGILAYFNALSFITSRGLSKYFFWSGLIGLGIFFGCASLIYQLIPLISDSLISLIPWEFDMNVNVFNWISIALTSIIFISIFKYLMLIFTAPLMSVLSERVEWEITGKNHNKNAVLNIIPELIRGLRINLRNIIREIFVTLFLLVLGFIPLVGIISGFLIILVQGYYAGFGNHDFWAERHFSYRGTVRFMKNHKGMLAGNGVVYVFLLAIPILGVFIAPPLATVAATMEGLKELDRVDY